MHNLLMSFVHFSLCIQLRAATVPCTWDPSVNKGGLYPHFYGISLPAEGDRQTKNTTSLSYRGCSKVRNTLERKQSRVSWVGLAGRCIRPWKLLQGPGLWCRVRWAATGTVLSRGAVGPGMCFTRTALPTMLRTDQKEGRKGGSQESG